jgi:hypothetical protein
MKKLSAAEIWGMLATIQVTIFCFPASSETLTIKIYKTVILHVVLYGCEIWSLTLWKEHRLRIYGNRVLRRKFGLKIKEVAGGWRRVHNDEFHNLYALANAIMVIRSGRMRMGWACHIAYSEEIRNACKILVGNPEKTTQKT